MNGYAVGSGGSPFPRCPFGQTVHTSLGGAVRAAELGLVALPSTAGPLGRVTALRAAAADCVPAQFSRRVEAPDPEMRLVLRGRRRHACDRRGFALPHGCPRPR